MTSNNYEVEIERIKFYLGDYTEDCVFDIYKNAPFVQKKGRHAKDGRKIEKSVIFSYLKEKYNIAVNCGKGSINYWIIRGFSEEFAKKEIKKVSYKFNSLSIDGIMKRHNVSEEEAITIQKERTKKAKDTFNNKSEEEKKKINRMKSQTLENYIRIYGEEEGIKRYKERCAKNSKNTSLVGFIERYGEEEGTKRYNEYIEKKKNACSLSWFIEKYGEDEGKIRYQYNRDKKSFCHTLEGYISKFGEIEGIKRFNKRNEKYKNTFKNKSKEELQDINRKKSVSLENMIKKYGYEEGIIRYNSWREKQKNKIVNSIFGEASKTSLEVFIPFYIFLLEHGIDDNDIYFGLPILNKNEYTIQRSENNSFYMYDFTILSKRIIIEFNGKMFHPRSYDDNNWKHPKSDITVQEAYTKDVLKKELAESNGFKVIVIWDTEKAEDNLQYLERFYEKNYNNV